MNIVLGGNNAQFHFHIVLMIREISERGHCGKILMPKILYLISEDWFFCSHFLARAKAAQNAGFEVVVMTHVGSHADTIRSHGLRVLPWNLDRRSLNPLDELKSIFQVWRVYRAERPFLVHHVALKPLLHGSLAARFSGIQHVINAPVGMGYIFSSSDWRARLLRIPIRLALRLLLNPRGSRVIFESPDAEKAFIEENTVRPEDARLIRGAGIDLALFQPIPEPDGAPAVILPARMLWDKGVKEFVTAARQLKAEGMKARFLLAGAPDTGNFAAIPEETLRAWEKEGVVEYLGFRSDIPDLLRQCAIICLPSAYREGLPKALLEGLAAARPIVTTDVEGCRETVVEGVNGLMVPPRDPTRLANALRSLLADRPKRILMGQASRKLAETEFSQEKVISETLAVYDEFWNAERLRNIVTIKGWRVRKTFD
jgi:glycosyltransferase involved in cell wall biosynthesis